MYKTEMRKVSTGKSKSTLRWKQLGIKEEWGPVWAEHMSTARQDDVGLSPWLDFIKDTKGNLLNALERFFECEVPIPHDTIVENVGRSVGWICNILKIGDE